MSECGERHADERANNLLAAGALWGVLAFQRDVQAVPVLDGDGNPTNQLRLRVSFLKSAYILTVEREQT